MTNCEAIALLDHIMKIGRNSPEGMRRYENEAILKGIMALMPEAKKEKDYENCRDFFENCCIKDEEDFARLYRKTPSCSTPGH